MPHVTCLISSSGKVVITGARNELAASLVMVQLIHMINAAIPDVHARMDACQVQNITVVVYLGRALDIAACARDNPNMAVHVPMAFPGMYIQTGVGTIRHIVFKSGRIVATGARSEQQAMDSLVAKYPLYERYMQHAVTPSNEPEEEIPATDIAALLKELGVD